MGNKLVELFRLFRNEILVVVNKFLELVSSGVCVIIVDVLKFIEKILVFIVVDVC